MSDTGGAESFDPNIFLSTDQSQANIDAVTASFEKAFGDSEEQEEETETPPEGEGNSTLETGDKPDEEQGGEEGGDGQQSTGATGGEPDFATLLTEKFGRQLSAEDVDGLIDLANWASQLKPEQSEAINAYLLSGGQLTPPTPPTPPEPSPYEKLADEYKDDQQLGPLYAGMVEMEKRDKEREAELQTLRNSTISSIQQEQLAKTTEALDLGSKEFQTTHKLTDDELSALTGAVTNSRIFPGFVNAHNGNVQKAITEALSHVYWASPEFRERAIAAEVEAQNTKEQQEHKARKGKASAVSGGGGGNGASRTAPPPKTDNDRWAAVRDGLAAASNNGQS